jgi:superfamily II DNA or RNA helicase
VEYREFLRSKHRTVGSVGFDVDAADINPKLFSFQKDIVRWAVKKGRCAIFLDTGLGKTFCQLEWARLIGGTCLILAPLSVARQTMREAVKIGLSINFAHDQDSLKPGINISNYDLIDNFTGDLTSVVLDLSPLYLRPSNVD